MACLFLQKPPPSDDTKIVIGPTKRAECIGGVFNSFDESFPERLGNHMSQQSFQRAIEGVNDALISYWPCCFCQNFGVLCCLCTAGLSYCIPYQCVAEARNYAVTRIGRINEELRLENSNVRWAFVHTWRGSWIEIRLPSKSDASASQSSVSQGPAHATMGPSSSATSTATTAAPATAESPLLQKPSSQV